MKSLESIGTMRVQCDHQENTFGVFTSGYSTSSFKGSISAMTAVGPVVVPGGKQRDPKEVFSSIHPMKPRRPKRVPVRSLIGS